MPATTPAALVEKATWAEQRLVEGTLATIRALAQAAAVVVGEVVQLRARLGRFNAQAETADTALGS